MPVFACSIRNTVVPALCQQTLRCPAARCGSTYFTPVPSTVTVCSPARDALSLFRPAPHRALRARFAPVLRRCGPHSRAAPRHPAMPVPRAEIANSCPDSLPATLRCPAARHGPTSCSRVASGVAACCSMHDALRLPRVVSLARFARLAPVLRLAKDAASTIAPRRGVQGCP